MKRNTRSVMTGVLLTLSFVCLGGCSNMVLFHPKGPVGDHERFLILISLWLMLIVVLPAIVMAFWFARSYRASNTNAVYAPKWSYSGKIDLVVWLVPVAIVMVLSYLAWTATFRLDPYKPIDPGIKPVRVEVVSLDWKWLFIYPDQNIAAVNELVFPAGVPLSFRLTSDTVMTSFFIPQLGSQMYAMAGMQTRLHLLADEPGVYVGQNQEFSGPGYADMHFKAIATSPEQFQQWVAKARRSPGKLDLTRYEDLRKPTMGDPVTYFSSVAPGLFDHVMSKYMGWMGKMSEMKTGKSPNPVKKELQSTGSTSRNVEDE
jgi:cytochrome o ubiquinol oxidase subunit II